MASEDLFQEVNNSETFFDKGQECEEEMLEENIDDSRTKEKVDQDDTSPTCSEQHVVVETLSNENPDVGPNTNDEPCGETAAQSPDDIASKIIQLPMGRIRSLMKLDPDLRFATNESVFAVTRATELFIASLTREAYTHTVQAKKKTIQKRDVDLAISTVDSLMFLDGAMNF